MTGYLLAVKDASEVEPRALKPAIALLDPAPLVDPRLMGLALWAAEYYQHPVGEVLCALFPRSLREGQPHREWGEPGWRLTARGRGLPEGALARAVARLRPLAVLKG